MGRSSSDPALHSQVRALDHEATQGATGSSLYLSPQPRKFCLKVKWQPDPCRSKQEPFYLGCVSAKEPPWKRCGQQVALGAPGAAK